LDVSTEHGKPSAPPPVYVVAVGSPHGDDRAGWEVVERLRREGVPGVKAVLLREPLDLLDELEGCRALVLVDACRSGAEPGAVVCLDGVLACFDGADGRSSHGLGVAEALALAAALGRLPRSVTLVGVEAQTDRPGDDLSRPVRRALDEVYRQVLAAVRTCRERMGPAATEVAGKHA
jgi:hydrogenase maturation protease